jgi:LmbE family N-acetylglucosaminyl deacetylase|tara:strand:+ start:5728 stop:5850 length:123 start_codon:yes stop_codon:yes gene_type:complete
VLAIEPHPGDIEISIGGTLLKHPPTGDGVGLLNAEEPPLS